MVHSISFLPNPARKPEGLGEGGIEQFRGKPYISCARETGQNSNDAGSKDSDNPVVMKFDLHQIDRASLPFADELEAACRSCLEDSEAKAGRMGNDPEADRTVQFFRRAVREIRGEHISVLEIADYNTTGLTGPMDDPESVFNSLVKADGVNNKRSDDSGGAFGIGKKAAFATSNVQTVLYSTLTEDVAASPLVAIQARLQLLSHERDGQPFRAEGYWGNPDFAPITDPSDLPDWMVRSEQGTSLFVICFPAETNWARKMEISILTNFTTAIHRGRMEFEIDGGSITINRTTLSQRLASQEMDEVAKGVGLTAQLAYARQLLKCLSSGETQRFTFNVDSFGKADLLVLAEPELPRRILIVRNGMYITDHLAAFDHSLAYFPQTTEFIAVLEPSEGAEGKKFGALLKRLENPEHNAFEPSRIIGTDEQDRVRRSINQLVRAMREKIREVARVETSNSDDIEELAHLFAAEAGEEDSTSSGETDPERFAYGQAQTKPRKKPVTPIAPEDGDMGGSEHSGRTSKGDRGGGQGSGAGSGSGGSGTGSPRRPVPLAATRVCGIAAAGEYSHEMHFTPQASGSAEITVAASGLTTVSELPVASAGPGKVEKGRVLLDLEAGRRVSVRFNLSESFNGPMELSAILVTNPAEA